MLPCPALTFDVELPADPGEAPDLTGLPTRAGVFAFEDDDGHTLCLATTANVRRLVRERLTPPPARSRRVDYRATTRHVRATPVGSAFEADWVYLQQARMRFPQTYESLLDRWQAWFVHCDPDAQFPRFARHGLSGKLPAGALLGPARDKQSAQRWVELLERLFDLCRYHHVLVQAPNGTACAYKDMGRCPAPCDGTVGLDAYRSQIDAGIRFSSGGREAWAARVEGDMQRASAELDFEAAERLRRRLAEAEPAAGQEFGWMDALSSFRWIALMPAERAGWTRVFAILGGWIAPVADVPTDAEPEVVERIARTAEERAIDVSPVALENIGLVSHHLYYGRTGAFVRTVRGRRLDLPAVPRGGAVETADRSMEV